MDAVGLDLDGVLYPWHESVLTHYEMYKGYTGSYTEFWGEFYKTITKDEWEFLTHVDFFYSNKLPSKKLLEFLEKVASSYEIFYISSRPGDVGLTTEQYLKRYNFPFRENLILTDDKSSIARLYKVKYFIDDQPKHLESLSKVTKVAMKLQPYNHDYVNMYTTVSTFEDMLAFLNIRDTKLSSSAIELVTDEAALEFMKG